MALHVSDIQYARTEDGVHVAYQTVTGEGTHEVLLVPGFISHLEHQWTSPGYRETMEHLTRFAKVTVLDRRGVGLSDPVPSDTPPTVEDRMDDLRAVMDTAGLERCAVFAMSEATPVSLVFAATYPNRVDALVLFGAMARTTAAEDYPFPTSREAFLEANRELIAPFWGQGATAEIFVPSRADDPGMREWYARIERLGGSPGAVRAMYETTLQTDVRHVLPSIHTPTLVLHQQGDRVVNVRSGRWLADQIEDARFVELPGSDHAFFHTGLLSDVVDVIEEFVTGRRPRPAPDRVLSTVLFTDIVDSTGRAAEVGDAAWKELLDRHDRAAADAVEQHGGRLVKTTGDGVLATFDRPSQAVRCVRTFRGRLAGTGLVIRAGLHTGEVELRGDDIGGLAVHAAARVMGHAAEDEVMVSRTVVDLTVGSGLEFEGRGIHELKGVPGEWQLFEVVG